MLTVTGSIRVSLPHDQHHFAARTDSARCPPLAAVEHILITISFDLEFHVGSIT